MEFKDWKDPNPKPVIKDYTLDDGRGTRKNGALFWNVGL